MNIKSIGVTALALFAVLFVGEYLIHEVWLKGAYQATASLWRPVETMKSYMGFMLLGYAFYTPVLTILFSKGFNKRNSRIGQGFRFGLLIGLLQAPYSALIWYSVLPIPATLAASWFCGNLGLSIVLGIVAGLTYRE